MIVVAFSVGTTGMAQTIQEFERLERRELGQPALIRSARPADHCWIEHRTGSRWRTTGVGWEAVPPYVRRFDVREPGRDERTRTIRRYRLAGLDAAQEQRITTALDLAVGTAYNLAGDLMIGLCVLLRRFGVRLFWHLRTLSLFCSQLMARVLAGAGLSILHDLGMRDDQITPDHAESWIGERYPRLFVTPTPPAAAPRSATRVQLAA